MSERLEEIINKIESMSNNYRTENSVYISKENVREIIVITQQKQEVLDLLIVPFLIDEATGLKYELHYYEIECEKTELGDTRIIEYNAKNALAEEIKCNIKPKTIINQKDYTSFVTFLNHYFDSMESMTFTDDKTASKMLRNKSNLYYEVY
ncbi:hypothetical protein [Listeria costaricensis]|uniref:hypothetical protein n=1 Tax=Listeria costaricensis TaxID=2026604 RepID=UPI000C076B73|nr:hypothetical protein [Listeria costaricensis]